MQSYGRMIIDPVQHINLNLALYIKLLFCSSQLIIQIKKKKKKEIDSDSYEVRILHVS